MQQDADKKIHPAGIAWLYLIPLALAVILLLVGAYVARTGGGWSLLASGVACVVIVLSALPIAMALGQGHMHARRRLDEIMQMHETRLRDLTVILNIISEQQLLSDRARSVAYREKDREALRRAIQDEITSRDFEAALSLVNDMESAFGYKQEAERFRQDIVSRRDEINRQAIGQCSATIERLCREENWDAAGTEAMRAAALYPSDAAAIALGTQVKEKKSAHKKQLLDSWRDSLSRKDVDGSIEILKRLDAYLTASEAAEIQEDARNVFRQRLKELTDQFGAAVHEEKIPQAISLGETIMRDFPNTRIAQEIRERMDVLKQRAETVAR
ncbi:MAG TPA: hypothetical protein VGG19_04680 [Tepidisphaeraceae bacterium]|jgi:hypothetical protein